MKASLVQVNDVFEKDGQPITTSRTIAERFGKEHFHVMRDIKELKCSAQFSASNFGWSESLDSRGKMQPECSLTFDGFMGLVMEYRDERAWEIKEQYIAAFNLMRAELANRKVTVTAVDLFEQQVALFRQQDARLKLVESKMDANIADQRLTASQVATLDNLIRSKCTGLTGILYRRRISGICHSIKTEFLKSSHIAGMTWKDCSSAEYDAIVKHLNNFHARS